VIAALMVLLPLAVALALPWAKRPAIHRPLAVLGVAAGLAVADRDLLDRGIAAGVTTSSWIGRAVAAWQSGYVRLYALAMFLGLAAVAVVAAVVGGRP